MSRITTNDGASIPCDTLVSVTTNGENGIFIIPVKNKRGKKEFDKSEEGVEFITEFISRFNWDCEFKVIYDENTKNFYVNINNMKNLEDNLLPLNTFSIEFEENFIFYFNINNKIELKFKNEKNGEEIINQNQTVPSSSDFPKFGKPTKFSVNPNVSSTYSSTVSKPKPINMETVKQMDTSVNLSLDHGLNSTLPKSGSSIKIPEDTRAQIDKDYIKHLLSYIAELKREGREKDDRIEELINTNNEKDEEIAELKKKNKQLVVLLKQQQPQQQQFLQQPQPQLFLQQPQPQPQLFLQQPQPPIPLLSPAQHFYNQNQRLENIEFQLLELNIQRTKQSLFDKYRRIKSL